MQKTDPAAHCCQFIRFRIVDNNKYDIKKRYQAKLNNYKNSDINKFV